MVIIGSERLVLRIVEEKDVDYLTSKIFTNASVTKFLFEPLNEHSARTFIRKRCMFQPSNYGLCVMAKRESNEIIGVGGLIECSYNNEYEFGYVLEPAQWGKGYATEIGKAQIDYGFNHLGLSRIYASVHKDNIASINVLSKLNLRLLPDIDTNRKDWLAYSIDNNQELKF